MDNQEDKNNLPKEHPFHVPEGYFDQLKSDIFKKIEAEEDKNTKHIHLGIWHYASIAAVILVALAVGFNLFTKEPQPKNDLLADVSTEELVAYLNMQDITAEEIIEYAGAEDINASDLDYGNIDENIDEDLLLLYGDIDLENDLL